METTNSALLFESDLSPSPQDENELSLYNFVEETNVREPVSPKNTNSQRFENGGTIRQPKDSESVKTVPKIILRRVSGETNCFEIQGSKPKKKKKKHSKRKSSIRSEIGSTENETKPYETIWISDDDDDDVILCSDKEINNNKVCFEDNVQDCLDKSTEMYSDVQTHLNYLNGICLQFKAMETLTTELAEALYVIISAQKDRLQRQLKCANLSVEFVRKEKFLAEEQCEKVFTLYGPQFTKCFKKLEDNLLCLHENLSSVYLHILQRIFDAVRKIDETIQATVDEVRHLVISILKENNHKSKVFDFLTDDHQILAAIY
uniref:Uncharacterized protein n=1 Tax=Homalodisca liturata TaxID=320908 RepID=A0A1B6IJ07_9HEMI